jgi:hypothetical protein
MTMCAGYHRYALKNMHKEQDGFEVVYTCGGCAEEGFIQEAFEAHRLASKKLVYMGRINVTPAKVPKQLVEFRCRHLGNLKLHAAQTLRLMLLSGYYVLGPEMVNNGVSFSLPSVCILRGLVSRTMLRKNRAT